MSDFQDFLNTLTPEQLRQLADMKEGSEPNKKRKQSRKKIVLPDEETAPQKQIGPKRKKNKKRGTLEKKLGEKGNPCKRLGPTPLGNRPNRFENWSEANENQEDIEIDKLLTKNRKPSPRLKPERQQEFVDATCTRCDDEFSNVSVNACYKDSGIYVFTCDDCIRNKKELIPLSDVSAERGVLSGICQYGQNSFLDVADIIQSKTFTVSYNEIVFACVKHVFEHDETSTLDVASIYSAGEELGLSNIMSRQEVLEHISSLFNFPISETNVRKFAAKIRKLEIARNLRDHLKHAGDNLLDLDGNESISHILGIAEDSIFSFSSGLSDADNEPKRIGEGLVDYIQHLGDNPIDQIGIPTGFSEYDKAIGGGLRNGTINVIAARPKALANTSLVYTEFGTKTIGNLKIGDKIYGPSGNLVTVLELFPQGKKQLYKITFNKKFVIYACEDHLWTLYQYSDFKTKSQPCIKSTQELKNDLLVGPNRYKWMTPTTNPIKYKTQTTLIDPYILGLLLGDGGLTTSIKFTNNDQELIKEVSEYFKNTRVVKRKDANVSDVYINGINPILRQMGLKDKVSHNKFIPQEYIYNDVNTRLSILQGLMDSDGSCRNPTNNSCQIVFTTTSQQLADGLQQIVHSLGGLFYITYDAIRDKNWKQSLQCTIVLSKELIPFRLKRKIDKINPRKFDINFKITSIEKTHIDDATCIRINKKDGLFLTNNYIPTHNCGKTTLAGCMGFRIAAEQKIPVLNMDTEMTFQDHVHKTLAMASDCFIYDIETGKFAQKPHFEKKVKDIARKIQEQDIPYDHRSIAGMPFEEQLAIMRRWIIKKVGIDSEGKANPCVIIYDYLKLMTSEGIGSNMAEFQALGFMMSSLHNFSVRYGIPILALMQSNREGITKEGADVASGSDRIVWLCSNFTIFKMKSDEEIAQDGVENGNRKLVPIVCRHGAGMEDGNYINCFMKGSVAKVTEGETKFELMKKIKENPPEVEDDDQ